MARLIDANKLPFENQVLSYDDEWCLKVSDIENAPTVDAVEVVRCKDCEKWHRHTMVDRERGDCRRYQTTKHESGFCDKGERRTDE